MSARVKFYAYFRECFGAREREVPIAADTTIKEILDLVCDTPERRSEIFDGETPKPHIVIMKNGAGIHWDDASTTRVKDGDVLSIFPLMGGG